MKSDAAKALLAALQPQLESCLSAVDSLDFVRAKAVLEEAVNCVRQQQEVYTSADEDTLNGLAILSYYVSFFSEYVTFWERVTKREYEPSWMALQDALDSIRLLKRLSSIDVNRFEDQLLGVEKTYPYKVFASIGCIAARIECSICGKDIDSLECSHRRGHLYMGKMAYGIVRDIKALDHVALTMTPEDKRCVMQAKGDSYSFPAIDWLAANLEARRIVVSDLSHIEMSQRRRRNEKFVHQGRNDPCHCGSGKKFKHCCIDKEYTTYPHANLVFRRTPAAPTPGNSVVTLPRVR